MIKRKDLFYTNVIWLIDQILSRIQDESLCRSERCLAQQNWAITYFTSVLFGNYILPLTLLNQKLGRNIYFLGAAGYLTGASNLRKRSRDSTIVQPLDDDAKVEDASEK